MCYSIFYRAMFIKMRDGSYIPMIESGDSNVWDVDRNRRSREWSSCRWLHESDEQRSRFALTADEIIAEAQREIDNNLEQYVGAEPAFGGEPYTREDVLKDLGFFNAIKISGHSTTSASAFLNFFKSGIRNAVTMEELRCGLRFSWYEAPEEGEHFSRYCTDYAKDENELYQKWSEFQSKGITPWIGVSESNGDYAWEYVKNRNRKPRAEKKAPTEFFVIAFDYGGCERFVVKLTSHNLKYNPWKEYAYKYSSKKLAENASEKIARRFSQITNVRVVNA